MPTGVSGTGEIRFDHGTAGAVLTGALVDAADGRAVVASVQRTSNAWERLRGLLGRPCPGPGQGLLIDPCGSVHTLFMAYPIDVVYLDRRLRVVQVTASLRPWRLSFARGAALTLELAPNTAAALGITAGRQLAWRPGAAG